MLTLPSHCSYCINLRCGTGLNIEGAEHALSSVMRRLNDDADGENWERLIVNLGILISMLIQEFAKRLEEELLLLGRRRKRLATNTQNNNDKKKRRSLFSEANELEEKLKATRKKADFDRENSLSVDNARDVAAMLLARALRKEFEKTDKLQGGSFIHGSMERLHSGMWKGAVKK